MEKNQTADADCKSESGPQKAEKESTARPRFIDALDVTAKLVGAGAVVATALIANNFQSSMTATSVLNQREQAESALRANMFHDLIGPIIGAEKSNGVIPADRERLLVELLTLNFHEHFELKPIILHVDRRLGQDDTPGLTQEQKDSARASLRSIARRVIQRQLAMLTEAEDGTGSEASRACIYQIDIGERQAPETPRQEIVKACSRFGKYFDDLVAIRSPNGTYFLTFTVSSPDWENQTFPVSMKIANTGQRTAPSAMPASLSRKQHIADRSTEVSADNDFVLTWYDFPLTDNTLLADGTRFSLVIDKVDPDKKTATLKLLWFPQDYFSARERPTNYRQLHEKLGITRRN